MPNSGETIITSIIENPDLISGGNGVDVRILLDGATNLAWTTITNGVDPVILMHTNSITAGTCYRFEINGRADSTDDLSHWQISVKYPHFREFSFLDTDADGLSDVEESLLGTNALVADSDGDGIGDGVEVRQGGDPLSGFTGDPSGLTELVVWTPLK